MTHRDTVDRILDAALELFNERGVGAVSSRAVAVQAGVSSGNLHYHFHSKEAIVRALLEQRRRATDPLWTWPDAGPSLTALEAMLTADQRLGWRYRFLYRELVIFALNDSAFGAYYYEIHRVRVARLQELLTDLVDAGQLRADPDRLRIALTAGWILSQNWLPHLESLGLEVTDDRFAEGARLILASVLS